ncbi:MAG: homoserine dehydrogenase [Tepidisphaeraceae bacterium]
MAFEASCGGGIPIIDALHRGLAANRIDALVGIVNGTCNYILTKMTREGSTYADALKGAQDVGFAEADPTLDVSGRDAAQKLVILAGLAFGKRVKESDLQIEGIDTVDARDIAYAGALGYVIKLLAIAERQSSDALSLRVHPTLVHKHDVLADVSGGFNAISVYGDALGHALFYGRGAGQMPTASAVVADLLSVASGIARRTFDAFRFAPDLTDPVKTLPIEQSSSRYYLRLTAKDMPGVMAAIADALGKNGISIASITQQETAEGRSGVVPIVATTHRAIEGSVRKALKLIDALPTTAKPSVCLRIHEPPASA